MAQEEAYFFEPTDAAMLALTGVPLGTRVDNTVAVYEAELERARDAQGGFLNTTLGILGFLLPVSGTAASIALSDPDDVQTVAVAAGAATTAVMALNLLLRPGAKRAAAIECASFLEGALEAYERRWGTDRSSVTGTREEWTAYLTMRATLESGRVRACG